MDLKQTSSLNGSSKILGNYNVKKDVVIGYYLSESFIVNSQPEHLGIEKMIKFSHIPGILLIDF